MNTKSEYPVTDSITRVADNSIIVVTMVALLACEIARRVGRKMEGVTYKGVKSTWGLVKGAKARLSSYRQQVVEKVDAARSEVPTETPVQPHEKEGTSTLPAISTVV